MKATFPVSAPAEAWAALSDPSALAAALPGCRSVTRDRDGDCTLHVVTDVAVAAVRGLWAGTVVPMDADTVRVTGSGEPGSVDLVVRADPGRTALTVEGSVDGPLGTVGSAVLAAAVRRTAEAVLAAAESPPPARGHRFQQAEPEVIGSKSETHDLGLEAVKPMTSGAAAAKRRLVGAGMAAAAAVVAVGASRWRRAGRRRPP
jgi:carbon monoxide dehydrogenase subunit G